MSELLESQDKVASPISLESLTEAQLFKILGLVLNQLWSKDVLRSHNNPVADYAEHLVVKALDLKRSERSTAHIDATDRAGAGYQIKGRLSWLTVQVESRGLIL